MKFILIYRICQFVDGLQKSRIIIVCVSKKRPNTFIWQAWMQGATSGHFLLPVLFTIFNEGSMFIETSQVRPKSAPSSRFRKRNFSNMQKDTIMKIPWNFQCRKIPEGKTRKQLFLQPKTTKANFFSNIFFRKYAKKGALNSQNGFVVLSSRKHSWKWKVKGLHFDQTNFFWRKVAQWWKNRRSFPQLVRKLSLASQKNNPRGHPYYSEKGFYIEPQEKKCVEKFFKKWHSAEKNQGDPLCSQNPLWPLSMLASLPLVSPLLLHKRKWFSARLEPT